jgi:hypothetical protein
MTQRPPRCRYCDDGHAVNESGEHWIVKSIFPAKIDIHKCPRAAQRQDAAAPVEGERK